VKRIHYRDPDPFKLPTTVHNLTILRIQHEHGAVGMQWHRTGLWAAIPRIIRNTANLAEINNDAEDGDEPLTLDDFESMAKDAFSLCARVIPDLWRLALTNDERPCLHAVEVEDTCRVSGDKYERYGDLHDTLDEWQIRLRLWITDRCGQNWREVNLEAISDLALAGVSVREICLDARP
jgi:hypothetical protein